MRERLHKLFIFIFSIILKEEIISIKIIMKQ